MSAHESVYHPGDIVQIRPDCKVNPMFSACLMTISEVKSWGVMGYVQGLGENGEPGGQAYIRLNFNEIEPTGGKAPWVTGSLSNLENNA